VGADLRGANLRGARLADANLAGADLQGAILSQADLTNANLVMAKLRGSNLVGARVDGADLAVADLSQVRLTTASLTNVKMEGVNLVEASLERANLDGAFLSHSNLRRASFNGATLRGADLSFADLRDSDLRGADLSNASLLNANLEGAILDGAILEGILEDAHTVWPTNFDPAQGGTQPPAAIAARPRPLTMQINLTPGSVSQFNEQAGPGDIARIDHISDVALLQEVRTGKRMVVFKSAALAEQLVPRLAANLDLIGYNLEHGPVNGLEEQQDPVAATRRVRAVADSTGVRLAIGPDHQFVTSHGTEMAPLADQFVLQVQRVQGNPELVYSYVVSTSAALRQANPNLEIVLQVRTDGDLDALVDLLHSLRQHIDGVAILTSARTTDFAVALWERMRADAELATPAAQPRAQISPLLMLRLTAQGLLVEAAIVILMLALLWTGNRLVGRQASSDPSL
jgi:uncharacterized protein YjbI with pentapeptide repeats